ncbi:MAG: B12-binding domain-containing radical SAM protein [Clostridia bacterium]|nr:B12-binding domain-containing radical SAM protein [Clostridia bacterium]
MKLILAALNSKYVHTSLSVRCLKSAIGDICDCHIREYTINDTIGSMAADLYSQGADCIAFSCYIWNIEQVLKLASVIKKANPSVNIVLGGHEVMYDAQNILNCNPQIDAVLGGEGEITLKNYISALKNGLDMGSVCGVSYRTGNRVVQNPLCIETCNLNDLDFVYGEDIDDIKDRIIYYESSRGCPFGCTYCISGADSKVRFLDADRVKRELKFFMEHKVKLVKFVDRTFNANPRRAGEIFSFIADNPSDTCFHMELAGDLVDDETIQILSRIKKGNLCFEIGVQTTNPVTMTHIERSISFEKLKKAVNELMRIDTVHIHLDLIAGLPHEDFESFKRSFNDVIALRPHVLQLGFLKLLKGSKIRSQANEYGYVYNDFAPYEVISNNYISYREILELKRAEEALDRYYNSGSFGFAMDYLFDKYPSPYDIFEIIGRFFEDNFETGYAFSKQKLFDVLYQCFKSCGRDFVHALMKDYLILFRPGKRPYWFFEEDRSLMPRVYELFKDEELKKERFPHYFDVPAKEIMKHVHPERIGSAVLAFDHKYGKIYDLSEFDL